MKCPVCGKGSLVLETRNGRRRRACTSNHVFYTEERVVEHRAHGGVREGAGRKAVVQ